MARCGRRRSHIEHSGYQDAAVYRRKLERNLRLLLLEDQDRPNDPFTLMNLGWAYKDLGQIATAMDLLPTAVWRCASQGIHRARSFTRLLVRGHIALGQRQQALEACRAGRAPLPRRRGIVVP